MFCQGHWTLLPRESGTHERVFAMDMVSRPARWAPRLTQATGVLLVLLGIIHLIATPFLIGWSSRQLSSDHAQLVIAAMRLNHVLVGILLLPLGVSTFWSGKAHGQSWGLRLAGLNAATLLCLPCWLQPCRWNRWARHCFGWRSSS
jgi:hypothetical protein